MGFYFICYLIVGMCFGMAGHIHLARQNERRMHVSMFWLNPSPLGESIRTAATFAPVLALLTSLLQGGLWAPNFSPQLQISKSPGLFVGPQIELMRPCGGWLSMQCPKCFCNCIGI